MRLESERFMGSPGVAPIHPSLVHLSVGDEMTSLDYGAGIAGFGPDDFQSSPTWEGLNPPYSTIVADPPWPQKGAGPLTGSAGFREANGRSRPMPYSLMTIWEIEELPVRSLVADEASLYLWTTNGFLDDAFYVMAKWGFEYSTTLVWAKNPMGGGLGGAFGISTEFVLYGWRGKANAKTRIPTTWFNWKRPYDKRGKPNHSAKPPAFLDMVETVSPGPYVELFARQPRIGWDSWGLGYELAADQVGEPG